MPQLSKSAIKQAIHSLQVDRQNTLGLYSGTLFTDQTARYIRKIDRAIVELRTVLKSLNSGETHAN